MLGLVVLLAYVLIGALIAKAFHIDGKIRKRRDEKVERRVTATYYTLEAELLKMEAGFEARLVSIQDDIESCDLNHIQTHLDIINLRAVNTKHDRMFEAIDQGLKFNQLDQLEVIDAEIIDEEQE